jgi:hypothetical protein
MCATCGCGIDLGSIEEAFAKPNLPDQLGALSDQSLFYSLYFGK